MLTIANIPLSFPTNEAIEWVESNISPSDIFDFRDRDHSLFHLPLPCIRPRPVEIGKLHWPADASRFSTFHTIVTDYELADVADGGLGLRTALFASSGPQAVTLVIDDESDPTTGPSTRSGRLSPTMYALPLRPLTHLPGAERMWLLTLVDERYWWWEKTASITITTGDTWAELISTVTTAMTSSTLDAATADSDYGEPSTRFECSSQPLPLLLDAIANTVGMRVSRRIVGTVRVETFAGARDTQDAELAFSLDLADAPAPPSAFRKRLAGGLADESDLNQAVPQYVVVDFPDLTGGTFSLVPHQEEISLTSLSLTEFTGVSGLTGFKHRIIADLTADNCNSEEVDNYARQAATDWYKWQLANGEDLVFTGIVNWTANGCVDAIEWTYREGNCTTRITPGQYNDRTLGMLRISSKTGLHSAFYGGDEEGCDTGSGCGSGSGDGVCCRTTLGGLPLSGIVDGVIDAHIGISAAGCLVRESETNAASMNGDCLLAGLKQDDCIQATGEDQTIILEYTGSAWTSAEEFVYPGGSGTLSFAYSDGSTSLTLDGLKLLNCGAGCYTGGPLTGHVPQGSGSGSPYCDGETFTICLSCTCCSIAGWDGPGWYCVENTGPGDCIPVELLEEDRCDEGIVICSGPYATLAEAQAACPSGIEAVDCNNLPQLLNVLIENEDPDCTCLNNVSGTIDHGGVVGGPWFGVESPPATCSGDVTPSWQMNLEMACTTPEAPPTFNMDIQMFGTSDCTAHTDSDSQPASVVVASPFLAIFSLTINGVAFTVTVTEP